MPLVSPGTPVPRSCRETYQIKAMFPAVGVRRDVVESVDVGVGHRAALAERGRTEPVGVDADEELAATLPGLGEGADVHDLPRGPDGDVAVGAVVRPRHHLDRGEAPHLPEAHDPAPV